MNWVTRSFYAVWGVLAWLSFAVAALLALLAALLVPGKARRQKLAALACRAVFVMPRVKVNVNGMDNLPSGDCIVVANHASYVDGPLLKGYLPGRFNFVIKGELRDIPIAHFLLRRSGAKFVERTEQSGSARDARRIVKAAQGGESLAFFPEGTFRKQAGVGRFRPGAFVAAVRSALPVVPVAISGTRKMLPSGRLLPWPVPLTIRILPAIAPGDPDFADNRRLAEAARQRILEVLDEPDLVPQAGSANSTSTN
ncbi:MAG: 1-acyl-sn-glycerol-3-phosphate acyltransferase [Gammaproteobacteria bacterium]|nr:1-acyl-sn-glycerol-3-phosphate acyltransferase [Gammaproteobacteria bacterium]MBT8110605.1 1-acyl-sn-glycerol-3-phosphate acyltransferase [Gammaproteobacteria bacterium]NND46734.1 1-acyl-sn-glycerol-3-phosphate acyltransferase [Woeseiaceae bacterium]NNL45305.1 1-acyl-sn-glycerol-3-phosphate acyltransferase [Woeseiaceae bacterium]